MNAKTACPNCAQSIEFNPADQGRVIACPNCEKEMKLTTETPSDLLAASAQLAKQRQSPAVAPPTHICRDCGTASRGKMRAKGSGLSEFILWLFGAIAAGFCASMDAQCALWPFILPAILYSVWRMSTHTRCCPACGSSSIIPRETPIAHDLAARYH